MPVAEDVEAVRAAVILLAIARPAVAGYPGSAKMRDPADRVCGQAEACDRKIT
jgi:hypothetical protein